jgi:Flp pilus assembly protein TadD
MRDGSIGKVSSGLFLAAMSFTVITNGQSPGEAYRIAMERLSPRSEHHSSRDYSAAIGLLDRVIEGEPRHQTALRCRGLTQLLSGNPEAAIRDFDRALQLDPTDAVLYYGRGSARQLLGNERQALADFQEAVHRRPGYGAAIAAQERIFVERGMSRERDRIQELHKNLLAAKENEVLIDWRDFIDFAHGRHFDLHMFFVTPFWSMIYAEYRDLKRLQANVPLGEKRITDAETLRRTAVLQAASRDLGTALATLDRCIRLSPQEWRAYSLRAAIWAIKDDPRKALSSLNKAIELNPIEPNLYINRLIINWELGETDAAERDEDELDRISAERTRSGADRRGSKPGRK